MMYGALAAEDELTITKGGRVQQIMSAVTGIQMASLQMPHILIRGTRGEDEKNIFQFVKTV